MRRDTHLYWERKPVEVLIQAHISEAFRGECVAQGLSPRVVGAEAGISESHLYNRLHGRTRWSVLDVYRVCRVLGVGLDEVLPSLDEVFGVGE